MSHPDFATLATPVMRMPLVEQCRPDSGDLAALMRKHTNPSDTHCITKGVKYVPRRPNDSVTGPGTGCHTESVTPLQLHRQKVVYNYTGMDVRIHTCISVCRHGRTYTYMCISMQAWTYVCIHVCKSMSIGVLLRF